MTPGYVGADFLALVGKCASIKGDLSGLAAARRAEIDAAPREANG